MQPLLRCCLAAVALIFAAGPSQLLAEGIPYELGIEPEEFAVASRAWNPGPNTTRFAGGNPSPGSATFSIMGAGFRDVSGFDSSHRNQIFNHATQAITSLNVPGKTFDDYKDMINTALNVWDAPSGFTNLGYVADGNVDAGAPQASGGHLGDIRVAAWRITSGQVLAHAFFPATEATVGPGGTIGGDVHINTIFSWEDNPNANNGQFDLLTVLIHELGHSLGLQHSSDPMSVMFPNYQGARRSLSADDIAGIQAIYGVPEPGTFILLLTAGATVSAWRLRIRVGKRTRRQAA